MDDQSRPAEARDPRIESALGDYLDRVDRGETFDREKFLAQHPEIAKDLRSFIAAEEQLRKLAGAERVEERGEDSTQSFALHGQETIAPQSREMGSVERGATGLATEFGRYRIVRALGKGAMGTVYLAEDTQLQRQVALKTPHFEQEPTPDLLERFYREARAAATLRHPNICPVYDVGQIERMHYISMAFIEGHPLSAFIRSDKPQPERQILIVVRKLAQALQDAHDHGIVHRDLKPANIMVDKRIEPIIMDFGLARQLRSEKNIRITQSGMLIGTPAYMSPEQIDGEPDKVGPPSDQFSLGVILYELLTSQLPFRGSLTAVMAQIITKDAVPPSQLRPGLDPRVEAACRKMMAKSPADRFASLSAVAEELATILRTPAAKPKPEETGGPLGSGVPAVRVTEQSETKAAASGVLQSLTKKSVSGKDLTSLEELARKCLSRHDYEQVIQIVERIPEEKRNAGLQALLEESRAKADEIAFLICEIDESVRLNDRGATLKKAGELLKIKPGHHRALQVQREFVGYGKGGAARIGPLQQFTQPWNEGGWIPWSVLAFGLAVFGVMTAVIVIYLNKTAVVIDVEDPDVAVTVKGTTISITGPKKEKFEVQPGEQRLTISYKGLNFVTEKSFEIMKGQKRIVKVSIVDGQVVAKLADELAPLTLRSDKEKPEKMKGAADALTKDQEKNKDVATTVPGPAQEKKKEVAEEGRPPLLVAPFDATAAKNARQQWADHLKRPGEITNSIGMKLALIPPGEFHMGSADPRMPNDARPVHRVRIMKPFYVGVYEVTQAEFQRIMGVNPSHFHDDPRLPVESITWDDVQKFLSKLNAMPEERQAGRAYRLPTEAEWEYACRAGTETLFSFGNVITTNQANFDSQRRVQGWFDMPKGLRIGRSTRVGSYAPNAFGLYDMYGNVCEGVADLYSPKDYATSPVDDPKGPNSGTNGIARGGSWNDPATPSAYRVSGPRTITTSELGVRLACDILPGGNATVPNELASAASAGTSAPEGFVPLFNGHDLSGWHTDPSKPGNWRIEKGVLIGSGAKVSYLYSDRYNFQDFHLRVEARMNAGGNSGVYFRAKTGVLGYQADIINPDETTARKTGTLTDEHEVLVTFLEPVAPPNQWFTMDVIAEGNHIVIQVNGKTTADYTDEKRRYTSGRIALQQARSETVVEFRKIEIKELELSTASSGKSDPKQAAIFKGQWHVEGDELIQSDSPGHKDLSNHNAPLLIFGDENWSRYDLTLKAKQTRGNDGLTIVFHWLGDYDWCDFGFGVYQNKGTELVYMNKGKWGRQKGNYKSSKIEQDHWYSIKIEVRGDTARCFVDGKMKFQQTDARFTHGRIGLGTWGSAARFRQIKVTDSHGKLLWKGPPETGPRPATTAPDQNRSEMLIAPFDESTAKKAQQDWSDRQKTPVELTNSIGMRLRLIPPGQFRMGSDNADEDKMPAHDVRITRPVYFGTYEVTKAEFTKFAAATTFKTDAERNRGGRRLNNSADESTTWEPHKKYSWRHPGFEQDNTHPVVDVSWDDAQQFCEWLSHKEGKTYRLPTEAEWEYACRAGTTGRTYGADHENLTKIGNVADATAGAKFSAWRAVKSSDGWVYTSPVGLFRPNNFGLHDTIGNVIEWCSDWYGKDYYKNSPKADPPGPSEGEFRVARGGSFVGIPDAIGRWMYGPTVHSPDWGFRVVCEMPLNPSGQKPGAASLSPARSPKSAVRRLWQGSYSKFENWRSRSWRETRAKDGKVFNFQELARTPEYVEMIDRSRGKGGIRVRLQDDQMLMIWGGKNVDWEKQQSGQWESAAKDRDPQFAAVSAPADLAASSAKNDTRSLWKGAKSSFENTDPGKWHETFYKEEPGHDFNEVTRTPEFVEIVDPIRAIRIRLTNDKARFIYDGKGKDWGTFQSGSWEP